ncbi:unnamed protein product [Cochlearia groenlandica]
MAAYKATDHSYKISFYQTTVVQSCEQLPSELTTWSFARFEDIMEGKLGIEYLVGILGYHAHSLMNMLRKSTNL